MGALCQGHAELHVASVRGKSTVVHSRARNPLRLLVPRSFGGSVWAYTSSFGGGMVSGDVNNIRIDIDAESKCFFSTQSSTKIYKNLDARICTQTLNANLGDEALLIMAPDPVQAFAGALYHQEQTFHLKTSSNLVLVDWLSAGRTARGERWAFQEYSSRNEIFVNGDRWLVDAIKLNEKTSGLNLAKGRFNCLATMVVIGPGLAAETATILNRISSTPISPGGEFAISASPLKNGVIVRLASHTVEAAGRAIHGYLDFVPKLLADNPWARKW